MNRYHRQILLPYIGEVGQKKLSESHVLVVGCGALGAVIADTLTRAGVGKLTIVDRDVVEITNLQRQVLFDENDVKDGTPKAEAARRKLSSINSEIEITALVQDFNYTNAEQIAGEADVLLDGLDNFQTRYLLNDLSVKHGLPYVYGGAVATTGMACVFLPSRSGIEDSGRIKWTEEQSTPCLRCVFPEAPPAGTTPTCDTAGVLASVVGMIAHHQCVQTIKLLTGNLIAVDTSLLSIDVWRNETRRLDVSNARNSNNCTCCVNHKFEYLEGSAGSSLTTLCGRGAVQINPRIDSNEANNSSSINQLSAIADRLKEHGEFTCNDFLLRGCLTNEKGEEGKPIELTVFADGRVLVSGTAMPEIARTIYDKYIGG